MAEKSGDHTKIHITMQGLEVQAEGSQAFVEKQLPLLIEQLQKAAGATPPAPAEAGQRAPSVEVAYNQMSTNTIASQCNAHTGSDLVMAAIAHIILVQRRDTAARHEILDEMKTATTFYKDTFSGNLSSYLERLVKGKRLNLVAKDTYALTSNERQSFGQLLSAAS